MKLCANGIMGCTIEKGEKYAPRNPCPRPPRDGHILCDSCRVAAGGLPKSRVDSTSHIQSSINSTQECA